MSSYAGTNESEPRGFRFSLLALLALVTFICAALALYQATRRYRITAYLQVSQPRNVAFVTTQPNQQLTLVKSTAVLAAALQDPSLSGVSSLKGKADPVAWLRDRLTASFPGDGEILELRIEGKGSPAGDDYAKIVDAVIRAYVAAAAATGPDDSTTPRIPPPVEIRVIQPAIMTR
jgi:hypothetical protein